MSELNEAWQVLSDAGRRAAYDASLGAASDPPPPGPPTRTAPATGTARPRRAPVGIVAVLVVLVGVVVGTAYARRDTGAPSGPGPVDGVLEPGSCVQVLPGDLVDEVPCSGPRAGTVSAVLAPGSSCPRPTAPYLDRRARTVCVRPG